MKIAAFNFSDYASHLKRNLFSRRDPAVRSRKHHLIWTLTMIFGFPVFQLVHWSFLILDEVFRRKLKRTEIEKPVFIIGSFRSGSTFLQRLMGMDEKSFSSVTTWEMIFAPSILQRQLVKGFFTVDKWFGRPFRRLLALAEGEVFHEKSAHKMGLQHQEEDEGFFIHNYATSFIFFVNPYLEEAWKYYKYDSMEVPHRKKLDMQFYDDLIRRHMHSHPESEYYLSKSPTFSSRFLSLYEKYPDARFIYLARNPLDVLPSLMRWFTQVWTSIEKNNTRFPFRDFVVQFVRHWYVDALEEIEKIPGEQVKIVPYTDLVADPFHTVESLYRWLEIDMPADYREVLSREKAHAKKNWKPKVHSLEIDGFKPEEVREIFRPVFDRFGFTIEEYLDPTNEGT